MSSQPPTDLSLKSGGSDAAERRGVLDPGRLAVIGLGQLGGSLALAGRAVGLWGEIVGFGRREESLARARALGLCDRTTTAVADAVAGAATVVLSTPLRSIPDLVDAMAPALAPGTLVIDVGSVKGTALRDIESRLPASVDFVACHPLAGSERFGPGAASADLFKGRRCIVCPTPRTNARALDRARALWEAVGAQIVSMPADLHDQVMAAVSHLPHVAAYSLVAALGGLPAEVEKAARDLSTTSLRDTSRVAASSPEMWGDILLENAPDVLPLVDAMVARLAEIRDAMIRGDRPRLVALLDAARASRANLLPE